MAIKRRVNWHNHSDGGLNLDEYKMVIFRVMYLPNSIRVATYKEIVNVSLLLR